MRGAVVAQGGHGMKALKFYVSAVAVLCFLAVGAVFCAPIDAIERIRGARKQTDLVDEDVFLTCIRAVESCGNPRAVGRAGELSAYQFTEATWRQHSPAPFIWAQAPKYAHKIARTHLAWLTERLVVRGITPTVTALAMAWHRGPNVFEWQQISDYERRVLALYDEEMKSR